MPQSGNLATALQRTRDLIARHPAGAAEQATLILEALPGHPEAVLLLGAAQRRQGLLAQSRATLAELTRTQPDAAAAWHELGLTEVASGDSPTAIARLRRAVALQPKLPAAWRALGDALARSGEPAQAAAAYARQVQEAVHDPTLMAAADALNAGDLPRVERLLRPHLAEAPTDVAALRMLAEAGTRLGRYADAESLLRRCLTLLPGFAPALHNLAVVLVRENRGAEAVPHLRRLLAEAPGDDRLHSLMGAALAGAGDYEGAIAAYEAVLRRHPDDPTMWLSLGHALKTVGRRDEAVAAYRRAASLSPALGEAYWSLANLKTEAFAPVEVAAMRALLRRDDLRDEDRFHLDYALGRALEQAGDYPASFARYAAGARRRRAQVAYSADRTTRQLERTRALMTPSFFAAHRGGHDDPAPIFVVGLPRSGSTLIEQVLASHSLVEGTMELPELARLSRELGRTGSADAYPESLGALSEGQLRELGRAYVERTRAYRRTDRPFFIDKMPNNFVHVGLIHLILPRATIVDARRRPMATCFSAFKQHFARGQHYSYDLVELGRYYHDYVSLMAHFDEALPGRVLRVRYEALVSDTEQEVRRLLAHCGLPFEPACLRPHETRRAVRTASSEQVRRPISSEGLDHWRHYAPFLGDLRAALGPLADG